MFKKAVFPGKYIQGVGAIDELPSLIDLLGGKGMILASPTVIGKVLPDRGLDLNAHDIYIEPFRGECCKDEIARVSEIIHEKKIKVLVGTGGGKTIDAAKIAADMASIPMIVVPTIASTDAPCSGCAVLYSNEGEFESVHYQRMNPAAVLVDLDIIVRAPTRFLVAGMGDALSTWFEARSCETTHSLNECGGYGTAAGLHIAKLCYETLMEHGMKAKIDCEDKVVTNAFDRIVEANILLSGLGFESAGLASAHSIHNGLTALDETHSSYHGEKVAFGVLAGLQLTKAPSDEIETVLSFCEGIGLPTTLADIGLKDASKERLMVAAERACAPDQPIHHEAGKISPKMVLEAMLAADAIGKARKKR